MTFTAEEGFHFGLGVGVLVFAASPDSWFGLVFILLASGNAYGRHHRSRPTPDEQRASMEQGS